MGARVGRSEFTREMKKDYTILCPDMAPIHFSLLEKVFRNFGYNMTVLKNTGSSVVDQGLRNVHNDTCYPALLVIGQMIDALNSGEYDTDRVALLITQTGGGCRASNYIHLLRKALIKAGYGHVPVISLNAGGMEKNRGFKVSFPMLKQSMASLIYGDLLMLLYNQTRPYEKVQGDSKRNLDMWIDRLGDEFQFGKTIRQREMKALMKDIVISFDRIHREEKSKVKVGIVGEIYVKFSSLGNNQLEEFLHREDCEVMVPGLMGFVMYTVENGVIDHQLYGGRFWKGLIMDRVNRYLGGLENIMIQAVEKHSRFTAPSPFKHLKTLVDDVIGLGCKMGEGWLLPAEMMELVAKGYENIVVAQPFGCLPNHIVGKGIVANIKRLHPMANIVPIDYDPGATRVNQENRIKLMLSVAREKLDDVKFNAVNRMEESLKEPSRDSQPVNMI
jgi:predicted nucleotide-binding protein (sugar kinase/HSP70/actin superfamily)